MKIIEKMLGQARENSTNAVSVYALPQSRTAVIKTVVLANTSGADATYRLFLDSNGTTYDESTALAWDVQIPADSVVHVDTWYSMDTYGSNFAYRSSVANAITCTLFGYEVTG